MHVIMQSPEAVHPICPPPTLQTIVVGLLVIATMRLATVAISRGGDWLWSGGSAMHYSSLSTFSRQVIACGVEVGGMV